MLGAGAGAGAGAAGCARGGDRLLVPVLVLGVGRRCWCCELAVHMVETVAGAGCRVPVLVL